MYDAPVLYALLACEIVLILWLNIEVLLSQPSECSDRHGNTKHSSHRSLPLP